MPRPAITSWAGQLFKRQLTAALDWLEGNGGGGSIPHIGATPPASPIYGALWFDTTGSSISVGPAPPANPDTNDLWIDTA